MARRLVTKEVSLTLKHEETRFVVISDTHSSPHKNALDLVSALKPHYILHAGDIGSLKVIDQFSELAPVIYVRGNIDGIGPELPDFVHLGINTPHGYRQDWLLTHIALRGPKLLSRIEKRARNKRAQLVICGHSHVPFMAKQTGLAVFNPGSIGPRRFSLPIMFGMITLGKNGAKLQHFDGETGCVWSPKPSISKNTTE